MTQHISQAGQHRQYDVLIIGSGLAGLFYALQVLKLQPALRVALLCKETLLEGNSAYAQGGIAAVGGAEDSIDAHIQDTVMAGAGLCHLPTVEYMVRQAPEMIQALIGLGVRFSKSQSGAYTLAREGGHSHRRIYHQGDATGKGVMSVLAELVRQAHQIDCYEYHVAVNLIMHYPAHRTDIQGEVLGAYALDTQTGLIHPFLSKMVVLATGGAGKTYQFTSNPMVATGDGVAMAYRAGSRVGNMEFYQFHPTLLHHPSLNHFLISEAVRGEGGVLRNPETGERFMERICPDRKELATRDIVARAIFNEIESGHHGFVHLDITHQPKAFLKQRFPQIFETLQGVGLDMSQDPIPVVPAAHYQCGGVFTDWDGRTDLKRLYAIGEVAFTGLHGANRLASNSLIEALVMAYNAAHASLIDISARSSRLQWDKVQDWSAPGEVNPRRASQINAYWRGLRSEMTSYAGIIRTEAGLQDVLSLILKRQSSIEEYYWSHCVTRDLIELRNILLNAELIVRSALSRRESRGGHYREDFPNPQTEAKESLARVIAPSLS